MPQQTQPNSASITDSILCQATQGPGWWALAFVFGVGFSATALLVLAFHRLEAFGMIFAIFPLAGLSVAAFMMWRGLEIGRWVAALVLAELLTGVFFALVTLVLDHPVLTGVAIAAAVAIIVAIVTVLFAESVSDFVADRFEKRTPEGTWDTAIATLTDGHASPHTPRRVADPDRVKEVRILAGGRARLGRIVALGVIGTAASGMILVVFGFAPFAVSAIVGVKQQLYHASPGNIFEVISLAAAFSLLAIILPMQVVAASFAAFVAPFILSSPISVPFALRWHHPARILLFRPFNRRELPHPLVQFVRDHVAGFGHVYALADTTLHVPIYVRIPIVLGQIGLLSFRFQRIRTPSDILRVCRMMRRRFLRNLNWLFSLNKIFAIASTDSAWQAAVSRLACEVDLILIDLSGAKENVVWELQRCDALGKLDRVLLLVRGEEHEAVRRLLSDVDEAGLGGQLLIYDCNMPDGAARATELIAARLTAVGSADAAQRLPLPSALQDPRRRLQVRATAIVVAVLLAFAAFNLVRYLINRPPTPVPVPFARVVNTGGVDNNLRLELRGQRQLLMGVDKDGVLRVIDLSTGQVMPLDTERTRGRASAISPDGAQLAYADAGGGTVEDFSGTRSVSARWPRYRNGLEPAFNPKFLEFSPDGAMVAIGWNGAVASWMPGKSPPRLLFEDGPSDILLFSPDGKSLLAADKNGGSIEVWDVDRMPSLRRRWSIAGGIEAIAWSHDGTRIATVRRVIERQEPTVWDIQLWDPLAGTLVSTPIKGIEHGIESIAFGQNSDVLVWTDGFRTMLQAPGQKAKRLVHPVGGSYGDLGFWVFSIGVCCGGESVFGVSSSGIVVWNIASIAKENTHAESAPH